MNSNWIRYKIIDIAKSMSDAPFGSNLKNIDYRDEGVLVLQGRNIQGRSCDWSDKRYVSQNKFEKLKKHQVKIGELIFPKVGTIGKVGVLTPYKNQLNYVLSTNTMKLEVDPSIADRDYVYYYFSSPDIVEFINQISANSVQPVFNFTSLKEFEILLPPLSTQRRIAAILTALDDKIELNRRMNETLEGIAQAVWGEWFGRYANGQEDLPDGWRWGNILEIANLIGGGTPKTDVEEYWNGNIPWISAKDITPNNRSIIIETEKKITKDGLENSSAKLLPALSTVISARGTVGNYCLIPSEMTISQSNYALHSIEENTDFFLFQQVANLVAEMQQKSYGTVFDTITTKTFSEIEIPIPPNSKMVEYNEAMKPIFERRIENLLQSRTLAALRNALLPRLMRGEIKV